MPVLLSPISLGNEIVNIIIAFKVFTHLGIILNMFETHVETTILNVCLGNSM